MNEHIEGWFRAVVLAVPVFLSAAVAAQDLSLDDFGDQPLVRVSGIGKSRVQADVALLNLGVEARGKTAEEARAQAAAAMEAMLQASRAAGIEERDLQTQSLSLNPIYAPDTASRITGYHVQHQLTVKVRDMPRVGTIVDEALKAGGDASRMYGLSYAVEEATAPESEARAKAYANALAKAQEYAKAAGLTLGKPIRITEMPAFVPGPVPMGGVAMARMDAAPTPIALGEQEMAVTVEVVYSVVETSTP